MKKRTIFIWDIHGCFDEFELLIKKLKITNHDTIYLVWDMINKWPKSWKVIKFLYENQNQFKAIKWNHEIYFDKYLKWETYWNKNFEKLKVKFEKYPEIYEYFKNLPLYINNQDFLLIHWWLDFNKTLEEHTDEEITNIREINKTAWYKLIHSDKKIIYGHWAINGLNIYKNTIWLDWGCVYGKALHAYVIETWEIYTQQALRCYVDVFNKD